jgi:hypothetical protein
VECLHDPTDAAQLVDSVRRVADATPDDMAACILTSRAPTHSSAGCCIEELELDQLDLSRGRVSKFLRHAGVPADAVEDSIRVARATTRRHGGALVRVERVGGAATVSVAGPEAEPTARLSELPHDEAPPEERPLAQTPA